ncbi:hypothetical protein KG088_06305 [Halomonas sp. TRM85114]|uniref:hypothetical protein n=1 Tax=Halomonas jincaotanensis TaxID=2810616 RepID=UPI001BD5B8C2|nr:hypothetical protein [Halomonas jincaotanensis]MBS9403235.1 hypothetical protein [Halomonas jincaotanensis]
MELKEKTIVVTGAGRRLGQKSAEMIAAKGGRQALAAISKEGLEETARLCRDAGGDCPGLARVGQRTDTGRRQGYLKPSLRLDDFMARFRRRYLLPTGEVCMNTHQDEGQNDKEYQTK